MGINGSGHLASLLLTATIRQSKSESQLCFLQGIMEQSGEGKIMDARLSPQVCLRVMPTAQPMLTKTCKRTQPETQHVEVSQRGDSVDSVSDFLTKMLAPVSDDQSPEPDILRITLELPSVAYFLRSDAPVPKEILQLYSLKKTSTPTKTLFPAYLRLVAEKWDEVLLREEAARTSTKE